MADLDAIKRKIRVLLDMTVQRGCTEGEAQAAAAAAARLMQSHNLDPDDLVMGADAVAGSPEPTPLDPLWSTLAACTGCCVVRVHGKPGHADVVYHGREPAPTIAAYLHAYLARCVDQAVDAFRQSGEVLFLRRAARPPVLAAFQAGLVERLQTTLVRHFGVADRATLAAAKAAAGRALGPVQPGRSPHASRQRTATAVQIDALSAGRRAGAHISIRDGLAGAAGETAALIGG